MAFTTEEVVLDAERGVTLSVQLLPTGGWYPGITERPAVLILPGGGYNRPSEREAENVAAPFLAAGYHAMVLRYCAGEHRAWPGPLRDYEAAMAAAGYCDLQILGIGSDGHIGFNEPGGPLDSRTHVGVLTEQTRRDNARFFDDDINAVPTHCLTQGLGTIMKARKLVLIATGSNKAEAIAHLVEGEVSEDWPASVMQRHPDALVLVDADAASRLSRVG